MRFPSNRTLAQMCVYTSIGCISAVMYARYKIQDNIRKTDHFRESMQMLRTHQGNEIKISSIRWSSFSFITGAIHLLGEPIKESGFDLGDNSKNFCTDRHAQFEVKVKGAKAKGCPSTIALNIIYHLFDFSFLPQLGTMFFWADKDEVDRWQINRLELELKGDSNKRLIVKNSE